MTQAQRLTRAGAATAALALCVVAAASGDGRPAPTHEQTVDVGRSVHGARIVAHRVGLPDSPRKVLVVGNIHGDEPQGIRVSRTIRKLAAAEAGIDLWVIDTVNPDGLSARSRQNARGVDLNRNFDAYWRRTGPPGSRYYAGKGPFSEPESRAVRDLLLKVRPALTIWYHQPLGIVIPPRGGGDLAIARTYARLTKTRVHTPTGVRYTGTATTWQNRGLPGSTAFVVELPAGRLSQRTVVRHASAALAIARVPKPAVSSPR